MTENPQAINTRGTVAGDNQGNMAFHKVYVKDISYESPNTPKIFTETWTPDVDVDFGFNDTRLTEDEYEVELTITVSVRADNRTVFLAEVKMAGLFSLAGFADETMKMILGSYCPGMIFPYARELITELSTRGGFMPMILAPANFDILYAQRMQQKTAAKVS